jgi:predicted dehydrogenase
MTNLSRDGRAAESRNQLNVAVAGLGFMGATHLKAWKQVAGARVVAVMDSGERKRSGDLRAVVGNFGGPGEMMDFSNVRKYSTLEELLADSHIDAVDICLPTDQHAKSALAVLMAGKHALVEKPMTLSEREAAALLEEAKRSNRTLMVGQILRFSPPYEALADALQTAGPVRSAAFRRRCAAPTWSRWLTDPSRSGGGVFDLLIHDADYCISLWGMPESVRAIGYDDLQRGIDVVHAELNYKSNAPDAVAISGGWHHPATYPFSMDFTVVTDNSTFDWSSNDAPELREYGLGGKVTAHKLPVTDAFVAELGYFADCVINSRKPVRCPPEESAQSVALMHRILESREQKGASIKCRA